MEAARTSDGMDDSNSILQGVHTSLESCYLVLQVLSRSECEAGRKNEGHTWYEAEIVITYRLPSPGGIVPGSRE